MACAPFYFHFLSNHFRPAPSVIYGTHLVIHLQLAIGVVAFFFIKTRVREGFEGGEALGLESFIIRKQDT
jgi:hypothetical protein